MTIYMPYIEISVLDFFVNFLFALRFRLFSRFVDEYKFYMFRKFDLSHIVFFFNVVNERYNPDFRMEEKM